MSPPLALAIVGRPNVGKSTLFNRLAGKRLALVHDRPGLTRDWRETSVDWGDLKFVLIDTPGFEEASSGSLEGRMRLQTEKAIAQADACLFVIDSRAGVTPLDHAFAALLRSRDKPCMLIANKCEGREGGSGVIEAFELGFGEALPMSAEHGEGLAALYNAIADLIASRPSLKDKENSDEGAVSVEQSGSPLALAIMGRPNVGKSTLMNRLLGSERVLTGPEAGITRDAIAVRWHWQGKPIRLIDTAGLRRKSRISESVEKIAVSDAVQAMRFAEVVVLLLDSGQAFDKQDVQIADLVAREGRALVIAVNKWDLVRAPAQALKELRLTVDEMLPQIRGVPLVTLSALTGKGADDLMPAVFDAYERWNARIPTPMLNRWLREAVERHPPPAVGGRSLRLRYITQAKTRPPGFVIFAPRAEKLPEAYRRYLLNGLRETFQLDGVPLRLHLRKGDNPYVSE
jgi:GTP-binding protein